MNDHPGITLSLSVHLVIALVIVGVKVAEPPKARTAMFTAAKPVEASHAVQSAPSGSASGAAASKPQFTAPAPMHTVVTHKTQIAEALEASLSAVPTLPSLATSVSAEIPKMTGAGSGSGSGNGNGNGSASGSGNGSAGNGSEVAAGSNSSYPAGNDPFVDQKVVVAIDTSSSMQHSGSALKVAEFIRSNNIGAFERLYDGVPLEEDDRAGFRERHCAPGERGDIGDVIANADPDVQIIAIISDFLYSIKFFDNDEPLREGAIEALAALKGRRLYLISTNQAPHKFAAEVARRSGGAVMSPTEFTLKIMK